MSKLTIFMFSTIISSFALADFEIPNQFEDGQVTSASQMNENFQALKSEIEALKSQLTSQADNQVNLIGYSEESMNGGAGFFAMLQACENFASGSHVCNTDELLGSQYSESAMSTVSGDAWILPSVVAGTGNGSGWSKNGVTFSSTSSYRNCENWNRTDNNATGSAVWAGGHVSSSSCGSVLKVACCK
jgi:hypothetical protein